MLVRLAGVNSPLRSERPKGKHTIALLLSASFSLTTASGKSLLVERISSKSTGNQSLFFFKEIYVCIEQKINLIASFFLIKKGFHWDKATISILSKKKTCMVLYNNIIK